MKSAGKNLRQQRERSGRRAERRAELLLRLKGYRILARRYKTPRGEIDLVARRGRVLAIIEVKRRHTLNAARDSLTAKTRRRIMAAADDFIVAHNQAGALARRYDAIFVLPRCRVVHEKDVWRNY